MNMLYLKSGKQVRMTVAGTAALLGLTLALSGVNGSSFSPVQAAFAAGQGQGTGQGQGQGQGQGTGQGGQGYQGGGTTQGAGGVPRGVGGSGQGAGGVPKGTAAQGVSPSEEGEPEDSDRPDYAGEPGKETKPGATQGGAGNVREPGTKMGDVFGDMVVILRDANGVPILTEEGYVQPLDKDGNLIPLNEEGDPIDESLLVAVDLGRLNVGRSPSKVLDKAYDDAIAKLNSATSITLDPAGRLVLTIDGETQTIDSPRENLALYVALMENGYLPNLTASQEVLGDLRFLTDSSLTSADMQLATSLLAAGADKEGELTLDEVAYMNTILGIAQMTPDSYVNYSDFDYNRAATYPGNITYVVQNTDGTYQSVTEPILTAVFGGEQVIDTNGGIDAFTQSADDAREVINFIHTQIHPAE